MTWWRRLWFRSRLEEQLDKELRFHLDEHTADLIAKGHAPEEARRLARLALGGPEQVKEQCRDARGTRWLEDLWQDLVYALRSLRQRPGFAAVALATLALGIGGTTVMFTVTNGVLLKPLPYPEPDRLVTLEGHTDANGDQNVAYFDFLDCARNSRTLAPMAGWLFSGGILSEPGDAEFVDRREVSSGLFSVLKVPLFQGRDFLPAEDQPGGAPVAIVGHSLWQRHFAASQGAMSLVLDGKRYTVVGIAAAGFRLDGDEPDVFTPLGQNTAEFLRNRKPHPIAVLARLGPGATLVQARMELALIGRRLAAQYPDSNADRSFVVQTLAPDVGDVRSTLWLLLGAVSLVLLIACSNLASLMLARAVSRQRELAMRAALGAGRGRLVRQCLTESSVLGLAGGALGVALAALGVGPFVSFWPGNLPRAEDVRIDWRVLLFALAVSLASGILFGLAPALRAHVRDLERALRAGTRVVAGSSSRLHSGFVAAEIALAVVLLVAAGLLGRTLLRLSSLDPGVNVRDVLVTRAAISPATLSSPARMRAAWSDLLDRARRVPGVESVTMVDTVPMRRGYNTGGYWASADVPPENRQPVALITTVTPDYLKVMGIPLRRGRFFDDHDRMASEPVVVIDEVLAEHAFGNREPVGQRLWVPDMGGPAKVVGVVAHVRHWGLAKDDQSPLRAQAYYPFDQLQDRWVRRWSELMSIAIRTRVPPLGVVEPLRREVRGVTGDQVLYEVRTMEQLASGSLARQRFLLLLFGIFAGLALLLACIGVYGVLAYLTGQRVPEIGVRMAFGARRADVLWLVFRESLRMISLGVAAGAIAAVAAGRVLQRMVDGMQPAEPSTFVITIPLLVFAALAASFMPALRASRVDPVTALRQE